LKSINPMKTSKSPSAPHDKQRIVISLIGWVIEIIIDAIRKNKEKKNA